MRIVIFGAGDGGDRAMTMLPLDVEVVAFVDGDPAQNGTFRIPVYIPEKIKELSYDYIVIGCTYGKQITRQLTQDFHIASDRIIDGYGQGLLDVRIGTMRAIANDIQERNIPGCAAELGVFRGDFAKYINRAFPRRKLYLFDTFSGFDERDLAKEKQYSNAERGEFLNESVDLVLAKMETPNSCVVKKGYFPQTTQGIDDLFCFVSLDVDLYQPTYDGLNYFYDRLEKGGCVMVHDFGGLRFAGVKDAVHRFCKERQIGCVPIMDISGSVVITK